MITALSIAIKNYIINVKLINKWMNINYIYEYSNRTDIIKIIIIGCDTIIMKLILIIILKAF